MRCLLASLLLFLLACPSTPTPVEPTSQVEVERIFETDEDEACIYASPLLVTSQGQSGVLTVDQNGALRVFDPESGDLQWTLTLPPVPDGGGALRALNTPVVVGNYLIIGWQAFRSHHFVGVVDLETRAMSSEFEVLELGGSVPNFDGSEEVTFRPDKQLMRGIVRHLPRDGMELGLAYMALGNAPNSSPHHGWVFEINLDEWRASGADAAIINRFATTADNECGPEGSPDAGLCGGGIWNAAGLQFYEDEAGQTHIYFAAGNGRTNVQRNSYANTLMRLQPGLDFDPECDATLCENYDEVNPSRECQASCQNLFIPRLAPGEAPLRPESGECDDLTFTECYRLLDADLGASAPVRVELPSGRIVFVQPGKDGALYLVDGEHFGTMIQRLQVMDFCGTPEDTCRANWLGMFVTHPALAEVDGVPVVILASNMADSTHPSGISAVRVVEEGENVSLDILWQVPPFDSVEATNTFRHHPGRPVVFEHEGVQYVFVVETRRGAGADAPGVLWGVRVDTGEVIAQEELNDAGQRWSLPLLVGERLYVGVCDARADEVGHLEAFSLVRREEGE